MKCEDFNDMFIYKDERNTKKSNCTSIKVKNPYYANEDSLYKSFIKENDHNKCVAEKKHF